MSERPDTSGPQFRADRPVEQEAVRTTIVGGRPPGSGQSVGPIPRGIEVLVKKASVDADFRQALLDERAGAADRIGLALEPAEVMMLRAVPAAQLKAIIARTSVPQEHRRAFLGKAAVAMLAALGLNMVGCGPGEAVKGTRPGESGKGQEPEQPSQQRKASHGTRPKPPDRPPATKGIQPDRPKEAAEKSEPPKATEPPKPAEPKPKENTLRSEEGTSEPGTKNPLRPDKLPVTDGIRPDRIPAPTGSRPDPPPTRGIRPDRP